MIRKEMLKRCQNELKQAFCALPEDVQKAIMDNPKHAECLQGGFDGKRWRGGFPKVCKTDDAYAWRLSPDTPTDPEWYEIDVKFDGWGRAVVLLSASEYRVSITDCVSMSNFVYIIYQKDGIETLRTSIDAAFGTPVRVRFSKP